MVDHHCVKVNGNGDFTLLAEESAYLDKPS
jgi:hypothetical protein